MNQTANVLELLLEGKFICPYTYKDAFKELMSPGSKSVIVNTLHVMNKELKQTNRSGAYYCVYREVNNDNRNSIKNIQKDIHKNIRAIVSFVSLINEAQGVDMALSAGDEIHLARLAGLVDSSQSNQVKLDKLFRNPVFKKKAETNLDKITVILGYMRQIGLLSIFNKDKNIYQVTGKMDYIYESLEFIDARENIVEEINRKKEELQGELF